MKVWLDDVRPAPAGWTWVTTVRQAIEHLQTGNVTAVSLDHDLGLLERREQTGYDVLLWIEEQVVLRRFTPPKLLVHSANPPARERMLRAIDAIEQHAAKGGRS